MQMVDLKPETESSTPTLYEWQLSTVNGWAQRYPMGKINHSVDSAFAAHLIAAIEHFTIIADAPRRQKELYVDEYAGTSFEDEEE